MQRMCPDEGGRDRQQGHQGSAAERERPQQDRREGGYEGERQVPRQAPGRFSIQPHCIVSRALPGVMRRAAITDMRAMTARAMRTRRNSIRSRAFP